MKKISIVLSGLMLLACACTLSQGQNGDVDARTHLPLTYEQWHGTRYTLANGIKVCALSSGYNGLLVSVGRTAGGIESVVSGNRRMEPGATLTATVNGHAFQTSDTFFSAERGEALAQAMLAGGKAYLEWSEFSGPAGRERVHIQNILSLEDFPAKFNACKAAL